MKRNALFRIILWSIIIAVLATVMFAIPFGFSSNRNESPIELAPAVTAPLEASIAPYEADAVVTSDALNVRSMPSMKSPVVGHLQAGDALDVKREETVNGTPWAYITAPIEGWVVMNYIEMLPGTVIDTTNQDVQATESSQMVSSGVPAVVTATSVNVRQAPSPEAAVMGSVYRDDQILVTRTESISGITWAYTTSPVAGWLRTEYLEMPSGTAMDNTNQDVQNTLPPQIQETMVSGDTDGKDTFEASAIRELEIEWTAGDILIQPGSSDRIVVKEDGVTADRYAMYLYQDGDTLKIRYAQSVKNFIGLTDLMEKDLTIYVPVDWHCESLEIDAASATVEVNDLTIREVDFDGASGICEFENCIVEEIDIDTASGDVHFIGSLDILDCDAASASVFASLTNVPQRLDMDMMSGDLELSLPADAGFSLHMDTMKDNLTSEFETELKNGNYVSGNGACRINIDALSGDVIIRKG